VQEYPFAHHYRSRGVSSEGADGVGAYRACRSRLSTISRTSRASFHLYRGAAEIWAPARHKCFRSKLEADRQIQVIGENRLFVCFAIARLCPRNEQLVIRQRITRAVVRVSRITATQSRPLSSKESCIGFARFGNPSPRQTAPPCSLRHGQALHAASPYRYTAGQSCRPAACNWSPLAGSWCVFESSTARLCVWPEATCDQLVAQRSHLRSLRTSSGNSGGEGL
jgi:hypothetical protein